MVASSGEIAAEPEAALPPIGAPVSNTQIYVLDDFQRRVPDGKVGEMYIGGTGVARGYRQRADLTAQRFLDNPFRHSLTASFRAGMYRTGDLGRVLPDGRVALLLGASMSEETIRGHRVQMDEIVRVLERHPGVISSSLPSRRRPRFAEVAGGLRGLLSTGSELTSAVLRDFLMRQLPPYMVPSVFVRSG